MKNYVKGLLVAFALGLSLVGCSVLQPLLIPTAPTANVKDPWVIAQNVIDNVNADITVFALAVINARKAGQISASKEKEIANTVTKISANVDLAQQAVDTKNQPSYDKYIKLAQDAFNLVQKNSGVK